MTELLSSWPMWTDRLAGNSAHGGLYPLGIEAPGMRMVADALLPGITNATRRARYFSLLPWIAVQSIRLSTNDGRRKVDEGALNRCVRRLEGLVRIASLRRNPYETGVAGKQKYEHLDGDLLDLDIKGAFSAFNIASYGSSFRQLGLGSCEGKGTRVRATQLGETMASLVHASMGRQAPLVSRLLKDDPHRVSPGTIAAVQDALAVGGLVLGSPEHQEIDQLLMGETDSRILDASEHRARGISLALVLHVAECEDRAIDRYDIHRVFATHRLSDGAPYEPPEAFDHVAEVWRRYEERQFIRTGLYGLWYAVLDIIDASPGRIAASPAIVEGIVDRARRSALLANWLRVEHVDPALPAGVVTDALVRRARRTPGGVGGLALHLSDKVRSIGEPDQVGASLCLLLVVAKRWQDEHDSMRYGTVSWHSTTSSTERVALQHFSEEVTRRGDLSLTAVIAWMIDTCVLAQSIRVALGKLAAGQYRFFIEKEDAYYRVIKSDDRALYAMFDADRLDGALGLLTDLGYLGAEGDGANRRFQITKAGKKRWRAFERRLREQ